MEPFNVCFPAFGLDNVGPPAFKLDKLGPSPDNPPVTPPEIPSIGPSALLITPPVVWSSFSGTIPAFFIFLFSSSFAISSGEMVLNFGLLSLDDFFALFDEAFFSSACLAASSFAAFSFST